MDSAHAQKASANLFQVYLRLRPPQAGASTAERFLTVEDSESGSAPTHITLNPPNDRRRAIEKFAFTQVFQEDTTQLDIFHCTRVVPLVEGVLAPHGGEGTDALLATLGVTGSGKSHTILGSRTQRGLTQLALDVVFRSLGGNLVNCNASTSLEQSIQAWDASESSIMPAANFLETIYADPLAQSRAGSRAATPMIGENLPPPTPRRLLQRPSAMLQIPDVSSVNVSSDPSSEYAVVVSMYEVYNDRIFDLLTPPIKSNATKEYRRRPLLFKSTENSPDRKVVAGLRKVICSTYAEAIMVLEAGLYERRVAGTGSNSVSSRSHGFFCIEVKKRQRSRRSLAWGGSTLTIVDLAGSERARDAKTQGATLAEAGKINESLMYLGQCLQMQSDASNTSKPNIVPFRQCKLTELLFSNSFPSPSQNHSSTAQKRNPQRAVMIVTADPLGDFNATSQILRYSALAREVTVPRIPSIFSNSAGPPNPCSSPISPGPGPRPMLPPGSGSYRNYSPGSHVDGDRATMELAALEIARLSEEVDILRGELSRESDARMAAEAHLLSMEDKMIDLEQVVREDCVTEFETRLAVELARWKTSLAIEQERGEEHWDRKIEVFERGIGVSDEEDKENVLVENLEQENERLRRELAIMKRELTCRSPTKRMPLQERDEYVPRSDVGSLGRGMERLRMSNESTASVTSTGSPKKMRKLMAKKWSGELQADESM